MKKKLIVVVAIFALVLSLATVFAGCNKTEQDIEINVSHDYDVEKVEENLNALKGDGILVRLSVGVNADLQEEEHDVDKDINLLAYGAKGNIYYFQYGEDGEEMYLDFSNDDRCEQYESKLENGESVWYKTVVYYDETTTAETVKADLMTGDVLDVWSFLGQYAGFGEGKGTKTSERLEKCGRDCDKYVYKSGKSIPIIGTLKLIQQLWIDKETGACLKYVMTGKASFAEDSAKGSITFECTQFDTAWNPTLPVVDEAHTTVQLPEIEEDGQEDAGK